MIIFKGERTPVKHWRKSVEFKYEVPQSVKDQILEEIQKIYHLPDGYILTIDCGVRVDVYDKPVEQDKNEKYNGIG